MNLMSFEQKGGFLLQSPKECILWTQSWVVWLMHFGECFCRTQDFFGGKKIIEKEESARCGCKGESEKDKEICGNKHM